jgi:hypothetical protein
MVQVGVKEHQFVAPHDKLAKILRHLSHLLHRQFRNQVRVKL